MNQDQAITRKHSFTVKEGSDEEKTRMKEKNVRKETLKNYEALHYRNCLRTYKLDDQRPFHARNKRIQTGSRCSVVYGLVEALVSLQPVFPAALEADVPRTVLAIDR